MAFLVRRSIPCVVEEDDDILVVNKPPGWNTHAPAPFAGEGIYDWLRHGEVRWSNLAIVHRLDKETSGLIVFGKSAVANKSLTEQFARRAVRKVYHLVTDRPVREDEFVVVSRIVRLGDRYVSRPLLGEEDRSETRFRVMRREGNRTHLAAEPITGRTHQIRVHAADKGCPILGDRVYGGTAAERLWLHAERIGFKHPADGTRREITVPANFELPMGVGLRESMISTLETDAFRICHGAADGWPGWYVDRLGGWLLAQSAGELNPEQLEWLKEQLKKGTWSGCYHKVLSRQIGAKTTASPRHVAGDRAPGIFYIRENGLRFEMSFEEGYSTGLFLDQRENRRRCLTGLVAARFKLWKAEGEVSVLNLFAYTCGFSVCAAKGGARVTSVDASRKYLEWGKRNFVANGIPLEGHDFIHGDALDWLKRLKKKGRLYDLVILDPPTFSRTKEHGVFQAEKDYGKLIELGVPLVGHGGVLFAATNAGRFEPGAFVDLAQKAVAGAGRKVEQWHYQPQPPDFPIQRDEPAHLKTIWMWVH